MLSDEVVNIMSRSKLLGKELNLRYYFDTYAPLLGASDGIVCIEAPFLNNAFVYYDIHSSAGSLIFGYKNKSYSISISSLLKRFEFYDLITPGYRGQVCQGGVYVVDKRLKWRVAVCLVNGSAFSNIETYLVFHVDVLNPDKEVGVFLFIRGKKDIKDAASGAMSMDEFRLIEKTSESICIDPLINTVGIRYFTLKDFKFKSEYYANDVRVGEYNLVYNINSLYHIDFGKVTERSPGSRYRQGERRGRYV